MARHFEWGGEGIKAFANNYVLFCWFSKRKTQEFKHFVKPSNYNELNVLFIFINIIYKQWNKFEISKFHENRIIEKKLVERITTFKPLASSSTDTVRHVNSRQSMKTSFRSNVASLRYLYFPIDFSALFFYFRAGSGLALERPSVDGVLSRSISSVPPPPLTVFKNCKTLFVCVLSLSETSAFNGKGAGETDLFYRNVCDFDTVRAFRFRTVSILKLLRRSGGSIQSLRY